MLSIDIANFNVVLSSCPSVVNDRYRSQGRYDAYFQTEPEEWEKSILEDMDRRLREEQRARQLVKRNIINSHYFCVNLEGAIDILKDQPVGSCLFRPSLQGIDQIVLTYKMLEDYYVSYDVFESKKDPSDRTMLGKELSLCGEVYTELDEIIDRFIGQITVLVSSIQLYEKFVLLGDVQWFMIIMNRRERWTIACMACSSRTLPIFRTSCRSAEDESDFFASHTASAARFTTSTRNSDRWAFCTTSAFSSTCRAM